MKIFVDRKWMFLLCLFFILSISAMMIIVEGGFGAGTVGTQTCINCHQTWLDNDPSSQDILTGNASVDYLPANLSSLSGSPFYSIPVGYLNSLHYTPSSDSSAVDFVTCEDCHGGGLAHYGMGSIPTPIPNPQKCGTCHDISKYLLTSHANKDGNPKKFFDQGRNGTQQATMAMAVSPTAASSTAASFGRRSRGASLSLYKSNQTSIVTKNERIEECSVCHNYALQYPTFRNKIADGTLPNPQVSCGACHNSHIVGPSGNQPAIVDTTVRVTGVSGSTITAVEPVIGRSVFYVNNKPYKIDENGAQDTLKGVWTRGSAFNRPSPIIVQGIGTVGNSAQGVADTFLFTTGGLTAVRPGDTLFISGKATATVNLPADALNPGAPITVEATLEEAGFFVENVETDQNLLVGTFDQNLILESREDPARAELLAQLGTDKIGLVVKASVTYKKASGTGTRNVFIPFNGTVNFKIRDMRTNTETLCQSCHTQGKLKYTAWGKNKGGELTDLSPTHNKNIGGQYRRSGHANKEALAFKEFSSFDFGSSHQPTYPFDQSITGSGGVGSIRNKSNTSNRLTSTPNAANAYLGAVGNTNQVVLIDNYVCNQCHHGLGSVDYMKDRQGTSSAQVLWGDATVVCLTCHETHSDPNGSKKNLRVPVKLSFNSRFADPTKNPRGGINKFMDGTSIPSNVGNSLVCLFCHQARESGFTVYDRIKARLDPYTKPDQVINPAGFSFVNPHYLDGGAILWSKNAWEYFFNNVPQTYSNGIPEMQQTNCTGCHMSEANADNTEGGHTWVPRIETCQTCHGSITTFFSIDAAADYDGDGQIRTTYEEIGTITGSGSTGTGLFGQIITALKAKGIYYNPDSYPYFFTSTGGQFNAWTTHTLSAAFNLSYLYKAGNAVYVHNAKYTVQILQDSLRALGVTPNGVRPTGDRNATDYRTIVINP
jgi:hypothetical protein